jgi:hypothetical protein
MREIRAGHDLRDRDIVEPVSVEKLPRAVDDARPQPFAMTGRIGHGDLHSATKYYVDHILTPWSNAGRDLERGQSKCRSME